MSGRAPFVLGVLQARSTSRRLPGKVLKPLLGRAMVLRQIERLRRARSLDDLVLATSDDPSDDALAEMVAADGMRVHRGALDDVLARFAGAVAAFDRPVDHVARLTADCPLADPAVLDATVAFHLEVAADATCNFLPRRYPDGLDVEVVTRATLEAAAAEATAPEDREHVLDYVYARPERFRIASLALPIDLGALRWTVDDAADFAFVTSVYAALHPIDPAFTSADVLAFIGRADAAAALERPLRYPTAPPAR